MEEGTGLFMDKLKAYVTMAPAENSIAFYFWALVEHGEFYNNLRKEADLQGLAVSATEFKDRQGNYWVPIYDKYSSLTELDVFAVLMQDPDYEVEIIE